MEIGFRADLIIENKVIIELKSVENLASVHPKQIINISTINKLQTRSFN